MRRTQFRRQKMATAEHIKRQIATAVVIAVEKTPLLRPVNRIVRRVEIQDNILRNPVVRLHEQRHEQILDRRTVMHDLPAPGRTHTPSSSRFSVDFPATGAQSERFDRNFPARTAIIGSWRNTS